MWLFEGLGDKQGNIIQCFVANVCMTTLLNSATFEVTEFNLNPEIIALFFFEICILRTTPLFLPKGDMTINNSSLILAVNKT